MGLIILTSISLIRRYFYETFLRLHQLVTIIIIAGIWIHSSGSWKNTPRIYLILAGGTWIILSLTRIFSSVYRSKVIGQPFTRAVIWTVAGGLQLHVKIARPWKYYAGQYVYLCIPGIDYSTWVQSHPYFVAWWYKDEDNNDIIVFILESQRGFSSSLAAHSAGKLILNPKRDPSSERMVVAADTEIKRQSLAGLRTIVEGPYGRETSLDGYGTVLLFATGIGIAGQLPHVKQLLQGSHDWTVKARKISLYWEVESEGMCRHCCF
jgi:predicted ferric reductase